ncbi:MAG: O-antigen ligase family protein [Pirellulaceae bacterium]|nr:O-antigen ligase family protein [Pirellulaceae bacterium]
MNPILAIFLAVGVLWGVILIRRGPQVSPAVLVSVLTAYLFSQVFFGYDFFHLNAGPIPPTIDRGLLALLGGLWLLWLWQTGWDRIRLDGTDFVVLLWFGILSVSTLLGDFQFRNNMPLSRLLFFNFFPLLVYAVVKHTEWQPQQFRWLVRIWLVIACLLSVIAIAEWRGWHGIIFPRYIVSAEFEEFLGRGRGPLLNPVINGSLIVLGIAALAMEFRRMRMTLLPILGLMGMLLLVGAYATLTRSVWMSAAAVVAVFTVAWLPQRWRVAFVCSGLLMGGLVYTFGKEALNQFKRDQNVSVEDMSDSIRLRPLFAAVAWEMFQEKPVTGFGFGLYQKYKVPYHYTDRYELPIQKALDYTQHNVFLAYLVELGLVGCGVLVGLLATLCYRSWQVWSLLGGARSELAALGLFGFSVALVYAINGFFHDVSLIPMENCLLLFGLGMVGRAATITAVESPQSPLVKHQDVDPQQEISGDMCGHAIP